MQKQGKDLWKITYVQIQLQLFSFKEELFFEENFLEKEGNERIVWFSLKAMGSNKVEMLYCGVCPFPLLLTFFVSFMVI